MDKMDGNLAPRAMYFSSINYAERRLQRLLRKRFRLPSSRQATRWNCEAPGIGAQKGFFVVVVVVAVDIGISGGDAKRGVMGGTFELNPVHRRKCYCNTTYISQTLEEL